MLTQYIYKYTIPHLRPLESDDFLNSEVFRCWENNMTHKPDITCQLSWA